MVTLLRVYVDVWMQVAKQQLEAAIANQPSMAERFRRAYEERAERQAVKAERNWQQQRRRQARKNTAQHAILQWQATIGHA